MSRTNEKIPPHTDIPHIQLEGLMKFRGSCREWQIIAAIYRHTYGWHKDWDAISLNQFEADTGIPRNKVRPIIKRILKRKIILCRKYNAPDPRGRNQWTWGYSINPNTDEWLVSPTRGTPRNGQKKPGGPFSGSSGGPFSGDLESPTRGPSKEILKKEDKRKVFRPKYSKEHLGLAEFLFTQIQKTCSVFNDSDLERRGGLESWANTFRLMEDREGYSLRDIRKVIEWLPTDPFWSTTVMDAVSLRRKFAQLWGKMSLKKPGEKTAEELDRENEEALKDPGR